MNPETFFENFDLLADAPNGVQKLREMILQLAVSGKLVPQNPDDEPVNLKKQKFLPEIKPEEVPFNLPDGWSWIILENIGDWALGNGFPTNVQGHTNLKYLFSKVSDMNLIGNEKFIYNTLNTIDEKIAFKIKAKIHPPGTVIFPKIGGAIATNKRRILVKLTAIDNNCLGIIPFSFCTSEWLYILLKSIDFKLYQSGTSVPAINQGVIGKILIGLPPKEEQARIVAKVDQFMALCDELEAKNQKRNELRRQVNVAAMDKLLSAREPGAFNESWRRIAENFDLLYDTPETVGKLRQAILQLAVSGKLVPQNPADEPASLLLERIVTEKDRLIKQGKIKKSEILPPIQSDEAPYDLPDGWVWIRLGQIIRVSSGNALSRQKMIPGNIPVFGGNGITGYHNESNVEKPTIVIGRVGSPEKTIAN
jgi:type I restriction enzyme S subunit